MSAFSAQTISVWTPFFNVSNKKGIIGGISYRKWNEDRYFDNFRLPDEPIDKYAEHSGYKKLRSKLEELLGLHEDDGANVIIYYDDKEVGDQEMLAEFRKMVEDLEEKRIQEVRKEEMENAPIYGELWRGDRW